MTPADISIVIPTWNEEQQVRAAVKSAFSAGAREIIVCDGGSSDQTIQVAQRSGASVVSSASGRGVQLNSGFQACTGDMVLFLHADNRLDDGCLQQICDRPKCVWGAFRQRITNSGGVYRWLETGNAWRVLARKMPFGDQAMFVRTEVLRELGGVAEIPLMEDVDLSRRLRKIERPCLLPGPVVVDSRRWENRGVVRQTLRNWTIQIGYALGIKPARLRSWYR